MSKCLIGSIQLNDWNFKNVFFVQLWTNPQKETSKNNQKCKVILSTKKRGKINVAFLGHFTKPISISPIKMNPKKPFYSKKLKKKFN
jgi:hypothetical protein